MNRRASRTTQHGPSDRRSRFEFGITFQQMFHEGPDAVVGVNEDGTIALANARAESLFGYERDEMIGRPIQLLLPGHAGQLPIDRRDDLLSDRDPRTAASGMDVAGRRKDGTEFPAEISLSTVHSEGAVLAITAIRDGTERTRASFIHSATDAIVLRDLNGIIHLWNPAAERLFGWKASAVVGRSIDRLIPPEKIPEDREFRDRVAHGEVIGEYETERVHANGTLVHIATTMSPIRDRSGSIVGVSTSARDMTERRSIEAERMELLDQLHRSQRMQTIGQLASGIAHDFNNLLSVILNYADVIGEATVSDLAVQCDIHEIKSVVARGARLTRQLLVIASRGRAEATILDLNAVVADMENVLARTLGSEIDLITQISPQPCPVIADRGQVEQILMNLAVNSRDAMANGGVLTVETEIIEITPSVRPSTSGLPPGRYVSLSLTDTGEGMDPETAARAFEPFFTTKSTEPGSGLGLAIVYGIVNQAGGTVDLKSAPGYGTAVSIALPIAEGVPISEESNSDRIHAGQRSETVLVVDDERAHCDIISRILRNSGYSVLASTDPEEALDLAKTLDFDLMVTDVAMPRMSGPELVERIRRHKSSTRVLFMSGYSKEASRMLGDSAGDTEFIQKPFDGSQLLGRIQGMLSAVS